MTGGTTSMDVTSEAAEKAADDDGNPAGIEGKARLESCLGCYCCCLRCCCCYSFPSPPCETLVHGPAARRKRRARRGLNGIHHAHGCRLHPSQPASHIACPRQSPTPPPSALWRWQPVYVPLPPATIEYSTGLALLVLSHLMNSATTHFIELPFLSLELRTPPFHLSTQPPRNSLTPTPPFPMSMSTGDRHPWWWRGPGLACCHPPSCVLLLLLASSLRVVFAQAPPSQPTMLAPMATREGKHNGPLNHPPTHPSTHHPRSHAPHTHPQVFVR